MTTSTSLFVLLIFAILIFYGPRMLGGINVDGDSALTHGVGRFAESEGKVDLSSSLVFSQVLVIALPMAYTCVKRLLAYKKHFIASQSFLVIVASLLLVAVLAMSNQPLSQYRFFMMLIAFIPFIFPLLLDDLRMRNKLLKFLAGLMIVWFFVQFSFIIWDYASEWQILFCPPSLLIIIGNAGLIY